MPFLRTTIRASLVAFLILLAFPNLAQSADQVTVAQQDERIRDPYLPPPPDQPRTAAMRGPGIGVQVNVDANGMNIVGDAANGPSIAIDSTNPQRIVIGWRQFDTVASDFRQAGYSVSTDSGATWSRINVLQPGVFGSAPVLAADSSGRFYYGCNTGTGGVRVFLSTDGGVTWAITGGAFAGDKPWMAVDRSAGVGNGNVYFTWTNGAFSRSIDHGATWLSPMTLPTSPEFGTVCVGPTGDVFVADESTVVRSIDAKFGGIPTWIPSDGTSSLGGAADSPFSGPNPIGLLGQAWVATHPSNPSHVYLCGSVDTLSNDPLDVRFLRSFDGGMTWTSTRRVNDDPLNSNAWQWFGTMSVAPNGRIDVVWNDSRDGPNYHTSRLYYSYSIDEGNTWSPNRALSPSWDSFIGFPANNEKIGDYYHMISDDAGASLAWAATFNGEQDVYFLRILRDCNDNGITDDQDIANGTSLDCDANGAPDECEPDCDGDKIPDLCQLAAGDCNSNLVPDSCDLLADPYLDCDANSSIDGCECPSDWKPGDGISGLNGEVRMLTTWDPDSKGPLQPLLIAGGEFGIAGNEFARNVAAWDGAKWHSLGAGIAGQVYALAVYRGELFAGGPFGHNSETGPNHVARWDGGNWQRVGDGLDNTVSNLCVYNDELIAGGGFRTSGSIKVNHIARWDGSTWRPLGNGIEGGSGTSVGGFSVYRGDLIVGNNSSVNGVPNTQYIARWDGTTWSPFASGVNSGVGNTEIYNGDLIATGSFDTADGTHTHRIARWDGAAWQPLGTGLNFNIYDLTVHNGELIAAGLNGIRRWNGSTWQTLSGAPGNIINSVITYDSELICGGTFASAGGSPAYRVTRWNGINWSSLGHGMNGAVLGLTEYDGNVVAGGDFTVGSGILLNRIARRIGDRWQPLSTGMNSTVSALTTFNRDLIAGGKFTLAGGINVNRIARWDGISWQPLGAGMENQVNALLVHDNELIAGGSFTTADGLTVNRIAHWNGASWQPFGTGIGGTVKALTSYNGELIAAGAFTTAGGVSARSIAHWDGQFWQPFGSGLTGAVYALSEYKGELFAGGSFPFPNTGSSTGFCVSKWNGSSWQPISELAYSNTVYAFSRIRGGLIAGGDATARWNGFFWEPVGNDGMYGTRALLGFQCDLIAGGSFLTAGDYVSAYWARYGRLDCDDSNDCTVDNCTPAGCLHTPIPNCCTQSLDCDDGDPCTTDVCLTDYCIYMSADTDADADGVPDCADNCPFSYNPDQFDGNSNDVGDACECPTCPGDLDGNTLLDGLDIQRFINCSLLSPPLAPPCGCADLNSSGLIDFADIDLFVEMLFTETACP